MFAGQPFFASDMYYDYDGDDDDDDDDNNNNNQLRCLEVCN
jgi:hypothetical protein